MGGGAGGGPYTEVSERVGLERLLPVLAGMEDEDLFGISLTWLGNRVEIRAWRGKAGPCYDTGREAEYLGPFLAVVDDDNHLVAGRIRVCEKTARIYESEAYRGLMRVTSPDPGLLARLETDPVPFDCDTLADDAARVASGVEGTEEPPARAVVYPGPFRYAVARDGTLLHRGVPAAVPESLAEALKSAGRAVEVRLRAPPARRFQDLYGRYGPLFLVGRGAGEAPARMPDFGALEGLSDPLRTRLRRMLDRDDSYLMVQGSDPAEGGCCPLPQVGELNRLVRAGLLDSWVSPMSGECPVTVYAPAGEIEHGSGPMPAFGRNEILRMALAALL